MFSIRALVPSELDELLGLYEHLHPSSEAPSTSEALAVWREVCGNDRYKYFGAFADGHLVSSCALAVVPNLTHRARPYGILENVVTQAEFRRRGFGSSVLRAALLHAWSEGCYKVTLSTGSQNEATLRFYESVGFNRHEKQAFVARPEA